MHGRQRDLRRTQRKPKRQAAWISYGGTRTPIPCVIRLASARLNILPGLFTLNLTRVGKSSRLCRVVWRKKPHMGVRFVEPSSSDDTDLDVISPAPWRNAGAARCSAPRAALLSDSARGSLFLQVRHSDIRSGPYRAPNRPSSFAFGFLVLLLVASAIFYVAGMQPGDGSSWADEVCDDAKNFCEHPEWSAIPAVLMGVVFLAVKGMEL
jgi:hypothetical protein